MRIVIDDLSSEQVHAFLQEHLEEMHSHSPPESAHALDLSQLRAPDITFWSAWDEQTLVSCGALKELAQIHGEIKSMRTATAYRGRGAGRAVLAHIVDVAMTRGYERLSLETGSMNAFLPAQKLYQNFGFEFCKPFANYKKDPNSVFMTLTLRSTAEETHPHT